MLRRPRELGPPMLVPLAWTFAAAANAGAVSDHTLFIAHVVMAVMLAVFAVTGRRDMREGTLRVWWSLIVVGFFVTAAGAVGFQVETASDLLLGVALYGWMLLPAVGFLDTGRRATDGGVYLAGAAGCLLGAGITAVGTFAGVDLAAVAGPAVVGVAQTAGIVDAAARS
ncbi:hypothetical protein [Halovenus salina]|uniref:Uncharacterized protein n=1 Tax=Halovenus salina TaxID=1510225 RepID=A0ABD5W045_9EURY|nr:hypothetical protein [Halovenus salina]